MPSCVPKTRPMISMRVHSIRRRTQGSPTTGHVLAGSARVLWQRDSVEEGLHWADFALIVGQRRPSFRRSLDHRRKIALRQQVAPIDQPLGQLSALLGDRHRSEDHFEGAISRCRKIGATSLGARAQLAYAEVLLGFGDARATREAESLVVDAATELGARAGIGGSAAIRRVLEEPPETT